jgi:putative membrane protein
MNVGLKSFLQRWIISTVAVLLATYLVPGIHYDKPLDLLVATLLLGILNTFLRPLLMVLSLPFLILTLGLFTFVINALLLFIVGKLMAPHFQVAGFGTAFLAAFVISIISLVLNTITGSGNSKIEVRRQKTTPPPKNDDKGGPVIDV